MTAAGRRRLLLLDLDDTLAERPPVYAEWAAAFLSETGLPATLEEMIEADAGGHVSRREFHRRLVHSFGYDVPYDEFVDAHEEAVSGRYRLTAAASAALDEARADGWSLGIVTNGYTRRQTRKLVATGLLDAVDAVCISEDVGISKPDPAIFELAASRAGTTLDGAWMIGDNLDADVAGARHAGIRSVWVRRPHEWLTFTTDVRPDLEAADVAEAIRAVLARDDPAVTG